jgi:hypothetical protein
VTAEAAVMSPVATFAIFSMYVGWGVAALGDLQVSFFAFFCDFFWCLGCGVAALGDLQVFLFSRFFAIFFGMLAGALVL